MKSFLTLALLFAGISASAAETEKARVECHILYTNAQGNVSADVRQIIVLEPFQAKSFDLGSLKLVVNAGGSATLADDSVHTVVSVSIYDSVYQTPRDGQVSVSPAYPARATYKVEGSSESLTASCAIAR